MEKFPILCPGSGMLFENVTKTSHTREPRGQTFLNRNVALLSISPASHGQLVKMLITLELHGILGSNCICVYLNHCPAIGMHNCDEAAGKI